MAAQPEDPFGARYVLPTHASTVQGGVAMKSSVSHAPFVTAAGEDTKSLAPDIANAKCDVQVQIETRASLIAPMRQAVELGDASAEMQYILGPTLAVHLGRLQCEHDEAAGVVPCRTCRAMPAQSATRRRRSRRSCAN